MTHTSMQTPSHWKLDPMALTRRRPCCIHPMANTFTQTPSHCNTSTQTPSHWTLYPMAPWHIPALTGRPCCIHPMAHRTLYPKTLWWTGRLM